jgi:hypothetical protein
VDHNQVAEILRGAAKWVHEVTEQAVKRLPKAYHIDKHADYLKAIEFTVRFQPLEGKDYEWVWDYAEELYRRLDSAYKELDDKADALIKYLGGGTGLFTLLAIATIPREKAPVLLWALPSLIAALVATALAAWARKPGETMVPPTVEDAIKYIHGPDAQPQIAYLGQWHLTCIGVRIAVGKKAWKVGWATWLYVVALALLLLPVLRLICLF